MPLQVGSYEADPRSGLIHRIRYERRWIFAISRRKSDGSPRSHPSEWMSTTVDDPSSPPPLNDVNSCRHEPMRVPPDQSRTVLATSSMALGKGSRTSNGVMRCNRVA